MRKLALLVVLFAACGRPDLGEQLAQLKAKTIGYHAKSEALFEAIRWSEDEPFASKQEAHEWLAKLDAYEPIPKESFVATQLVLDSDDGTLTRAWLEARDPEVGEVFPALKIEKRFIATASTESFDAADWQALKRTVVRYAERSSAGPTNEITLLVCELMLARLSAVDALSFSDEQRRKLELLAEDARLLHAVGAARQVFRDDSLAGLRAADQFRHQLRVVLGVL